uniref:Uncharacterized protein n=1 Tax=Moniliophthora roreri TaxID=221103 RepID=A0A0W0GBJ8_MONRR
MHLHLGIFLGIAVSDEGVTTTTTSTETENSEVTNATEVTDPDVLVQMFVGIPDHEAQEVMLPDGRVVHVVRMGSAT